MQERLENAVLVVVVEGVHMVEAMVVVTVEVMVVVVMVEGMAVDMIGMFQFPSDVVFYVTVMYEASLLWTF